ncbi:fasciclin domain-containing protein, partial [Acidimicrobiales bacterium]|nr:fasciclin domain-containing protein [Acidimicrobiales bacterium]
TVFAPSNAAINQAASSDATVAVLAADQENVLTYHVVPGGYTVEDLSELARGEGSTKLMTVHGLFVCSVTKGSTSPKRSTNGTTRSNCFVSSQSRTLIGTRSKMTSSPTSSC